jgi:hypothetical protein
MTEQLALFGVQDAPAEPLDPLAAIVIDRSVTPQQCADAHHAISWRPDRAGEYMHASYIAPLESALEYLRANAGTPEIREKAAAAFERFQNGYRTRFVKWIGAKSRCLSSAVTGPSNFPVRRAQKANDREHNAQGECIHYAEKWDRVFRRICNPDTWSIRTEDPDAVAKIERRVEAIERTADRMVQLNTRYRQLLPKGADKKQPDREALAALIAENPGCEEELLRYSRGHFGGNWQPFPSWAITNARANQRRYEARAQYVERVQAQDVSEWEGTTARVVDNPEANRIQLYFPGKPDEVTRSDLKRHGFRWAPSEGAWQAYRTYHHTLTYAKEVAGVTA